MSSLRLPKALKFVGYIVHPNVNAGEPTPCYEMAEPADGRPSLNSLEGWNAAADAAALKNMRRYGLEPCEDNLPAFYAMVRKELSEG